LGYSFCHTDTGRADKEETPQLKEVSLEFTTTYIIGINFDIKFGPKHTPQYRPKASMDLLELDMAIVFQGLRQNMME